MWIWLTVLSALLLGLYDVAKKQALKANGIFWILLCTSGLSALFLSPFITFGCISDHYKLFLKAVLVSTSWISGFYGIKLLPLTTVSTIKASRPVLVVAFSIILFGERLTPLQWVGVILILAALYMLGRVSRKEGIEVRNNSGFLWMVLSVLTGAASALYDKHIMQGMEALFVQFWANAYIAAIMAVFLLVIRVAEKEKFRNFKWDWCIILIALLITAADALYFFALKEEGAMISVISLVRRLSVVVTFIAGGLYFKENQIKSKAIDLTVLLAGVALLLMTN